MLQYGSNSPHSSFHYAGCLHVPASSKVSSESGASHDFMATGVKLNNDEFVSNEIMCALLVVKYLKTKFSFKITKNTSHHFAGVELLVHG